MACANPVSFEDLVAYWAGDQAEAETDRVEEHVMGCASCSAQSARIAAVVRAMKEMIPPLLTSDELGVLRARGLSIEENPMSPGERKTVVFGDALDVLVHRLRGMDPARVAEVHVRVTAEETGEILMDVPRASFDRNTGDVLVACQRHFAVFPPNIVVEVRSRDTEGSEQTARYFIPHTFERRVE